MIKLATFMVAAFLMVSSLCFADSDLTALTPVDPLNVVTGPTQSFTFGWQFTVTSPITVTELGYYDPNGKLKSNHDVGIFASDGSLLLSTTITAGKYTTEDGFAFVAVPSFTLADGTYVIGGDSFDSKDPFIFSASSLLPIPEITLGETGLYTFGSTFTLPATNVASATYMGPDFEVSSPTAVPESSSFSMLVCAVLSFAFAGFTFRRTLLNA